LKPAGWPDLDDPARESGLRARIQGKAALKDWYERIYRVWAEALALVPEGGVVAEIGSGAGFAERFVPGLLRTDTLAYPGVDQVVDALAMPFADGSVRALFLLNVLHHLPDAETFLAEAQRVLKPGGLLMVTDQHVGPISRLCLRFGHHEPFDPAAVEWKAPVAGALAGANGALAWMVFQRDRARFEREFPGLELSAYRPFAPLQYWMAGGLKAWSLVPGPLLGPWHGFEGAFERVAPSWGSFAHSVVHKRGA
jgi:SAM-dependent methyltransferase